MFKEYIRSEIDFHIAATQIVGEFNNLKKLNDYTFVPLYQGYVPKEEIVQNIFPLLHKYLKDNNDTRNCETVIDYYNVSNSCITGVQIKFISEAKAREINSQN